MLEAVQIRLAVERLKAAATRPATVIIFGSYARGDMTPNSDLDLLVVESELPDKAAEYLKLKAAIGRIGVGVDLVLLSKSDFDRRSQVPGTLPYWAKKEGRVWNDTPA